MSSTISLEDFRAKMSEIASQWDELRFELYEEARLGKLAYGCSGRSFYKRSLNGGMAILGEWMSETGQSTIHR